ncbi:hypothetical protein GCM10027280_00320 [Micromonospora polyrhachis]
MTIVLAAGITAGLGITTATEAVANTRTSVPPASMACRASCDYRDPSSYRIYHSGCSTCYHYCNDDERILTTTDGGALGNIELRYSPRCRTAWARTGFSQVNIRIDSRDRNGNHRATASSMVGDHGFNWSPMLDGTRFMVRACVSIFGPVTGQTCTKRMALPREGLAEPHG